MTKAKDKNRYITKERLAPTKQQKFNTQYKEYK